MSWCQSAQGTKREGERSSRNATGALLGCKTSSYVAPQGRQIPEPISYALAVLELCDLAYPE
jgi:hypothetical protein